MSNRKDIINALTYLISEDCTENQFDYMDAIQEAIDLLKEQDPVKPTWNDDGEAFCGNCEENVGIISKGLGMSVLMNYCPECGRKVKWDD